MIIFGSDHNIGINLNLKDTINFGLTSAVLTMIIFGSDPNIGINLKLKDKINLD